MQSRLTPPQKSRRRARPDVDWRDAMDDHCFRLDMMAGLLEACGQPLEPRLLEQIGIWVGQEVAALQTLLDKLEKEAR
jgi:hypothetical protein